VCSSDLVTAWYEAWCIHMAEDHLVVESLRAVEQIAFADIAQVQRVLCEPPKALVKAGLLIGLLNWRALGPTLLLAGRRDYVVELVLRNGRRQRLGLTGVCHLDRLLSALLKAGVPTDPELTAWSLPPGAAGK
jgi:hypothetical protein